MFYYAQLNEENICIGVSQLSGEISNSLMIAISAMDTLVVGKKYNNGVWEAIEQPEPSLSTTEQAILQTAINTEYMLSLMETTI